MRFMLAAALLVAATACDTRREQPVPVDTLPKDTLIKDTIPDGESLPDTLIVDSAGASLLRHASYGAMFQESDTAIYKVHYSLAAPLPAGDTVQLRMNRDSVAGVPRIATLTAKRTAQRDSVSFRAPKVFGASARWYACRRVLRAGEQIQPEKCVVWRVVLPAKPVDSVWVDSSLTIAKLDLKPDKISVEAKKTVQFCAFVVFLDGKVAMRAKEKIAPECLSEYTRFSLVQRSVKPAQQEIADTLCVKFEATGGTISAETCQPHPLVGHPA